MLPLVGCTVRGRGDFCPGVLLSRKSFARGNFSPGVIRPGDFWPGDFCPGGLLPGGLMPVPPKFNAYTHRLGCLCLAS